MFSLSRFPQLKPLGIGDWYFGRANVLESSGSQIGGKEGWWAKISPSLCAERTGYGRLGSVVYLWSNANCYCTSTTLETDHTSGSTLWT
jgi:hypothetical protein